MLNQSQAKKVKNIYVELVPTTLLNKNIIETRKGLYESESCRKQDAIIKILQVQGSTIAMSNVKEIKLQASLHQMAKQSEFQSDYIVQCLSIQKTRTSFYYAFERLKYNLNDYLKAQNELDLLYLVDSLIQALKQLQKYGNHHGNLKPNNIFFYRKVGEKPIFKVSDFYCSENRSNEFISPEVKNGEKSNIASDIYSIGMICLWFTGRLGENTKKLSLPSTIKTLIDSMIKPTMDRINFQDLSDTVERLIESYQLDLNKQDYISRGLNQQKITQMIQEREQKIQYRDIREFVTQENKFTIRNKGQFFYLISEMMRPLKVNDYHLNQLIISSIFVSLQCYNMCLKTCNQDGSDFLFQSLLQEEMQQLEEYVHKVKLMIEIYCMDLQLQGIDIDIMKQFLKDKIDPFTIFRQALNKIVKEILDTNIIKKLQYEIKDKEQIKALNIIKYINMMNDGQYYDYKEIIIYITQQDQPI
ncbi:hypothetical protein pb186bvf_007349 [Paramecium bursaria]